MAMGYSLHTSSHQNVSTSQHAAQGGFGGQSFKFGGINFGTKTRNVGAAAGLGSVAGATSPLLLAGVALVVVVGVVWVARRKR